MVTLSCCPTPTRQSAKQKFRSFKYSRPQPGTFVAKSQCDHVFDLSQIVEFELPRSEYFCQKMSQLWRVRATAANVLEAKGKARLYELIRSLVIHEGGACRA